MAGGVFKKFIGGLALESIQTTTIRGLIEKTIQVIPFKSSSGIQLTSIQNSNNANNAPMAVGNYAPYYLLEGVPTIDKLEDYDLRDYAYSQVCPAQTTSQQVIRENYAFTLYTIVLKPVEDVVVNCIKFKKPVFAPHSSAYSHNVLICGYYLNEPLTIPAGDSRTITIELKVGVDIS